MKAQKKCVLVADNSRARLLSVAGSGVRSGLKLETELLHENPPAREILSDRAGRSFSSAGARRSAIAPHTDPVDLSEFRFAKHVADMLDDWHADGQFDRLVVVAPPRMLGHLRSAYSPALKPAIASELHKDLTKHADSDILDLLQRHSAI